MNARPEQKLRWTKRQRRYVEEYLRCWNGAEAARRAGYAERYASITSAQLMNRPEIKAKIEQRITETAMAADEVLLRLAEQARGDIGQLMREDGTIDLAAAREAGLTRLIKSVNDTDRGLRVEMYDAQAALGLLGKHLRLFVDSIEHSGPGGGPIPVKGYITVSPDDWDADAPE